MNIKESIKLIKEIFISVIKNSFINSVIFYIDIFIGVNKKFKKIL